MEAMRRQMERVTFVTPLYGIADVTLDFVEKVGAVAPGNLKYVKPFSGGSEAVEAAMKFVRQFYNPGTLGVQVRQPVLRLSWRYFRWDGSYLYAKWAMKPADSGSSVW
jgi:4-aminobutyrate aminotransferase-like enzyme